MGAYPEASLARLGEGQPRASLDDGRNAFAKDRDRLLYTSAFRKLSGKSQVVASHELGSFHTRLTHSIKVAQLGRRVAEQLQRKQLIVGGSAEAPDADLIEFACLAHDLGHPPFGHAGESALQKALASSMRGRSETESGPEGKVLEAQRLEFGSFEGNPQTFRILTRLAHKWLPSDGETGSGIADWYGLDLTAASLDSVTKYPRTRSCEGQEKWGCYGVADSTASPGDWSALKWAREATEASLPLGDNATPSFEAQVMNWCDDVAYAVHDVDDFYQAGLIPLEQILSTENETENWESFRDGLVAKWQKKFPARTYAGSSVTADTLDYARAELIKNAPMSVTAGPFHGTNIDRRYAHRRTSELIGYFLKNIQYTGQPMLHKGKFQIASTEELTELLEIQCDMLKELIWTYVINSPNLASQQAGQKKIVIDLFSVLTEPDGVLLLPTHFRELLDERLLRVGYENETLAHLRVVSDYISSLTELQAYALHRRVTGVDPGGLRDFM